MTAPLMLPYVLMLPGLWTVLLIAWYLVGTPLSA
jgi:p-aminobenzoyl-glutamate transporter AbgT